jgi:hypothetical protein
MQTLIDQSRTGDVSVRSELEHSALGEVVGDASHGRLRNARSPCLRRQRERTRCTCDAVQDRNSTADDGVVIISESPDFHTDTSQTRFSKFKAFRKLPYPELGFSCVRMPLL